ncbi:MAG: hypothetical protein LBN28_00560 [Desulfovibrio sp.]|jgi:hypothetical protein|nr:hypothetical protein [Desulfovibrio sp.]
MNSYKQSLYTWLIRIVANLLMFAAVFVSMHQAARGVWSADIAFCIWFFSITIPLWITAFFLTRLVKKRFPAEQESLVKLPKQGPSLVRWRVLKSSRTQVLAR